MKFSVITIFPGLVRDFCGYGLIHKALQRDLVQIRAYDLRDFARNRHRKVDDRPFGGGAGMVMKPGPLFRAVKEIRETEPGKVILLSAAGPVLTQARAKKLAREKQHLILVCGRYEGVDQRFIDHWVDEEISLGRYVLMGGELPSLVLIESVARLLPGVIGDPDSLVSDSHYRRGQVGHPQYTQPRDYEGLKVPEVLLSGDHRKIQEWRRRQAKNKTRR